MFVTANTITEWLLPILQCFFACPVFFARTFCLVGSQVLLHSFKLYWALLWDAGKTLELNWNLLRHDDFKPGSCKSDIWSLSLMLWDSLHGPLPKALHCREFSHPGWLLCLPMNTISFTKIIRQPTIHGNFWKSNCNLWKGYSHSDWGWDLLPKELASCVLVKGSDPFHRDLPHRVAWVDIALASPRVVGLREGKVSTLPEYFLWPSFLLKSHLPPHSVPENHVNKQIQPHLGEVGSDSSRWKNHQQPRLSQAWVISGDGYNQKKHLWQLPLIVCRLSLRQSKGGPLPTSLRLHPLCMLPCQS